MKNFLSWRLEFSLQTWNLKFKHMNYKNQDFESSKLEIQNLKFGY